MKRRSFLSLAATGSLAWARRAHLKIGVTDWNLKLTGKLEAVSVAQSLGFDGVQISIGRKPVDGKMPLDDPALIAQYVAEAKARKIPIDGTCLDILHVNYLKNDRLAEKWITDGIRITRALGTRVMLLPFFGKGALTTREEMDYTADALRNLGPVAQKAGVILGLENTISATDNLHILERAASPAVLVYYDIGNSTLAGFDPPREIRQLGARRICQFHFKDNPHYLGEGSIDMKAVLHAVSEIEFQGFANLETDSPSRSVAADMQRNLAFLRRSMADAGV